MTATFGTLTIITVYASGRRLQNEATGLIAAACLAFYPLHVTDSHFITTDVPVTFFASLIFYFSLRILTQGSYRDYAFAGIATGLAASTKYPGAVFATTWLIAFGMRSWASSKLEWKKLALSIALSGVTFALTTPYALIHPYEWMSWIRYVQAVYNPTDTMIEGPSGFWYARYLLDFPLFFLTIPALLGLFWLWQDGKRERWQVTAVVVFFYVLISQQNVRQPRALLPLIPLVALLSGYFIVRISVYLKGRSFLSLNGLLGTLTLFLLAAPAWNAAEHTYYLTQKGARALTIEWVVANLPSSSKIATDFASPVLPPNQFQVERIGWTILAHDVNWYQEQGFEYLIVSETTRYSFNRTVTQEAQYQAFFNDPSLYLIKEIEGHLLGYTGYHLWIYGIE